MVKRRTINEILSADEAAFLKKGTAKKRKSQPKIKEEQLPMTRPARKEEFIQPAQPQSPSPAQPVNAANLGSVNARVDPVITTAMMRASLERRIQGVTPSTHREIVAEALSDWLKRHGYLK